MISEPQNVLFSSYAADEAVRNLSSTNPQAAELPQVKQEEKIEDSVRVSISSEASEMLEQMEGETLAVANTDEGQESFAKEDNAFRDADQVQYEQVASSVDNMQELENSSEADFLPIAEQITLESNMEALESVQEMSEEALAKMLELLQEQYANGEEGSTNILNMLA